MSPPLGLHRAALRAGSGAQSMGPAAVDLPGAAPAAPVSAASCPPRPKTRYSDEELPAEIRRAIQEWPFHGEGHRKVWARLRLPLRRRHIPHCAGQADAEMWTRKYNPVRPRIRFSPAFCQADGSEIFAVGRLRIRRRVAGRRRQAAKPMASQRPSAARDARAGCWRPALALTGFSRDRAGTGNRAGAAR